MKLPKLKPRSQPLQERSGKTVDRILRAAARLLEDYGFEELTTNKICERAGMTPPALYRYFPNKYAIVSELGRRLMQEQNDDLVKWGEKLPESEINVQSLSNVLQDQINVTRKFPGGVAVLKTLYATPQLSEIRLSSHQQATAALTSIMPSLVTRLGEAEMAHRMRLIVEIGNSVIEMIIENPKLDEPAIVQDTAEIMMFYLGR